MSLTLLFTSLIFLAILLQFTIVKIENASVQKNLCKTNT